MSESLKLLVSPGWDRQNEVPFYWTPLSDREKERLKQIDEREQILNEIRSLSFADSKKYFKQHILPRFIPDMDFTPQHVYVLKNFHLWLWKDYACEWDIRKGIMLCGNPGCGKTMIMASMSEWSQIMRKRPFSMMYSKIEVDRAFKQKDTQVGNQFFNGQWCIDELGHENTANIFGNKINYISDLIEHRYQYKLITHATTNNNISESAPFSLHDIYLPRVVSRIKALFNIVEIKSKDYR